MSERNIIFSSGPFKIEGLFNNISGNKGVVVTHPHPLYGGNMMNNVVEALCNSYNECGYSSLRFNFRSVGRSGVIYDTCKEEQEDVKVAISCLADSGIGEIDLAGYSFGSWVIARGLKAYGKINRVVLVSPPVALFDYSSISNAPEIKLVIAGSEDDIADWRVIEKIMPLWNPDAVLKVIEGADHFYRGRSDELRKIIDEHISAR